MKMKRILYISLLILAGVACRNEDTPTPTTDWVNGFDVPEGATDATSILRREFLAETGCYLLFNDTIHKELVRYNEDGEAVYSIETVDLSYSISSAGRDKQSFIYLNGIDQQKKAVEFVKKRLLAPMSESIYPYSVLLADSIYNTAFYFDYGSDEIGYYGSRDFVRYYSGERCLAISTGDIRDMDEFEQKEVVKKIVSAMIISKFSADEKELASFYAYYEGLYGLEYGDLDYEYYEEAEGWNGNEDVREFGFLSGTLEFDDYYESYLLTSPNKAQDLVDYLDAIFGDEEIFLDENAEFPIVLQKYAILKEKVATIFDLSKL